MFVCFSCCLGLLGVVVVVRCHDFVVSLLCLFVVLVVLLFCVDLIVVVLRVVVVVI